MTTPRIEIESTARSDGSAKTWKLIPRGLAAGPGETPVLTAADRLASQLSPSIASEQYGLDQLSVESAITADDGPANGTGPLSSVRDHVFDGATWRYYLTDESTADRQGAVLGEPESNSTQGGSRVVRWRLGAQAVPDVRLARWRGLPKATELLTSSGSISAPSDTAYDTTSFAVGVSFRDAGSGYNIFASQRTASGISQWLIFRRGASDDWRFIVEDSGGAETLLAYDQTLLAPRPFHTLLMSYSPSRAVIIIDGAVQADVTPTVTPDIATSTAVDLGSVGGGVVLFDHFFVSRAMEPSELLSLDPVSLLDEDALESHWRGDGSGTALTDSGPLGNDAAISGTEGTDWQRAASRAGNEALAGVLIPDLYGHGRSLATTEIDVAEKLFAFARNPLTDGLDVRVGGDDTVAFTESDGIIDLSIPSTDDPVTVDTSLATSEPATHLTTFADDHLPDLTIAPSLTEAAGDALPDAGGGLLVDSERSAMAVLQEAVRGLGAAAEVAPDGRLEVARLVPPAPRHPQLSAWVQGGGTATEGPGPFAGQNGTLVGWVLPRKVGAQAELFASANNRIEIDPGRNSNPAQLLRPNITWRTQTARRALGSGLVHMHAWNFFAIRLDSVNFEIKGSYGPAGGTLTHLPTDDPGTIGQGELAFSGPPVFNRAGRLLSWSDFAIFDGRLLTDAELDTLFGGDRTILASADWHWPLDHATWDGGWRSNEASGQGYVDLGADPAPILQPEATITMADHPGAVEDVRPLPPASSVTVLYDQARRVLSQTEVTGGVTNEDKALLVQEWREALAANDLLDGESERAVTIESMVTERDGAVAVARVIADVLGSGLCSAHFRNILRDGPDLHTLTPHAEVLVTGLDGTEYVIRRVGHSFDPIDPDSGSPRGDLVGYGRVAG